MVYVENFSDLNQLAFCFIRRVETAVVIVSMSC